MKRQAQLLSAILGCLFLMTAPSAKASFIGNTVGVNYDFPALGDVIYSGGSQVIPAAGAIFNLSSGGVLVNVTGTAITVTFPPGWLFANVAKTFDGLVISDSSPTIAGITLASTNIPGFVSSDLTFDPSDVYVNFPSSFTTLNAGSTVTVNVTFVPEPAPLATLSLTILMGIAFLGWRKTRSQN